MNLKQSVAIFSVIPILGCVLHTLFNVFCDTENSKPKDEMELKEEENDAASTSNVAAQKHFRQLQHFQGA
ncbi:hypothetical protein A4A49_17984 [Nicotiana attenuata]|uniref:Uncharacterized protein n=1 Tax=Nicotiana attenuata TaxID=49451 RepID=A0A1J6IXA0_NICAT|nr:hypothetical protein A4A49_17984 [Nicotiana attenuata]